MEQVQHRTSAYLKEVRDMPAVGNNLACALTALLCLRSACLLTLADSPETLH